MGYTIRLYLQEIQTYQVILVQVSTKPTVTQSYAYSVLYFWLQLKDLQSQVNLNLFLRTFFPLF